MYTGAGGGVTTFGGAGAGAGFGATGFATTFVVVGAALVTFGVVTGVETEDFDEPEDPDADELVGFGATVGVTDGTTVGAAVGASVAAIDGTFDVRSRAVDADGFAASAPMSEVRATLTDVPTARPTTTTAAAPEMIQARFTVRVAEKIFHARTLFTIFFNIE